MYHIYENADLRKGRKTDAEQKNCNIFFVYVTLCYLITMKESCTEYVLDVIFANVTLYQLQNTHTIPHTENKH